jgi:4'-phosphopantetheinyl transferase EntD
MMNDNPDDDLVVYRLDLPHGRCVGVQIRDDREPLGAWPEEVAWAQSLGPARRPSFQAGRLALRLALHDLGFPDGPLLPDHRGAPGMPAGALGSISHKRTRAVGLGARPAGDADVDEVGVDLEEIRALRANIAPRVLTPAERAAHATLPPEQQDRFVLERFSLKEAFWKAVNRQVGPRISFQAVEIGSITPAGAVDLRAPWLTERGFSLQGWIGCPETGFILSSVRLRSSRFTRPSRA